MVDHTLVIEPAHVFTIVLLIGGAILGFMFKINRCVGRHEAQQASMQKQLDTITDAVINHLDKSKS